MMEASTARRLARAVQQSDIDQETREQLLTAIDDAVVAGALIAVMFDTAVTDGNSELLNELWEVSTYNVRADLAASKHDAT
jgi:hypothetical protein